MNVLVIGGSGRVGTGVLPYLAADHEITVFDLRPPQVSGVCHLPGSVLDPAALTSAVDGMDGVIYMAMNTEFGDIDEAVDINVRGVYHTLQAAVDVGLRHVVHTSTGSVHRESVSRFPDESLPLEALHVYGLTKGMGEMVCSYFCRTQGLSVIALRLFAPSSNDVWRERCRDGQPNCFTTHADTARAFDIALRMTDHEGFDAVFISGDHTGRYVNCARAKDLLGWEPLDRCPGQ